MMTAGGLERYVKKKIGAVVRSAERRERTRVSVEEHRKCFGAPDCESRAFLNVGPGKWRHPLWQNLDILRDKYAKNRPEIVHNLMRCEPIPAESEFLRGIYCSHVIEHLTDDANEVLFSEAHRMLQRGGFIRLVFPDVDRAYEGYQRGDRSLFLDNWPRPGNPKRVDARMITLFVEFFAYQRLAKNIKQRENGYRTYSEDELEDQLRVALDSGGPAVFYDALTRTIPASYQDENPGCHRNWWNVEKVTRLLREAGFTRVVRSAYLQSEFLALRNGHYFDQTHPQFSGYVEAFK